MARTSRRMCLDGGLATTLEGRGFDLSGDLWSARLIRDNPDDVKAVHEEFLLAGADIILTATYQATASGIANTLNITEEEAAEVMREGVRLAKEARAKVQSRLTARRTPLVAASLGPYGSYLADGSEYTGLYELDVGSLKEFHRRRVHILKREAPDMFAFETIPALREVEAICEVMKVNYPSVPFYLSMQCRDDEHLADGSALNVAVRRISAQKLSNCFAIGVNCVSPKLVKALVNKIKMSLEDWRPQIVCYPNSGEQFIERQWVSGDYLLPQDEYAELVLDSGADIVGGCCRTSCSHVSALRKLIDKEPLKSAAE